ELRLREVNPGPERDPAAPDAPISESYLESYGTRHGDPESLCSGWSSVCPIYPYDPRAM
ncbi:hypothetical protein PIB30_103075, partial [Stylosanthes scabra]|nr:hypothetical protein [Stylosanthes scabra]